MLWRNARDIVLLARAIKSSKCLTQARSQGRKITVKGERMKKKWQEENLFYGKLVETKKQKLKRLKLESAGKVPRAEQSSIDSEFAWRLNTTTKFNIINSIKVPEIETQQKEGIHTDSKANCNDQEVPEIKTEQSRSVYTDSKSSCDTQEVPKMEENTNNESTVKLSTANGKENKPKDPLLPNDVLQSILNFPIIDNCKDSTDEWIDNSKIFKISQMKDRTCLKYPSVTKILTATMSEESKEALEKWRLSMIEKYGIRGFEMYQAELLAEGKLLHATIMSKLSAKPYEVPDKVTNSFNSLTSVFEDVDNVRALESHVIHSKLFYRGIVDCVAVYRGDLCLIDWKKSDKSKNTIAATYDAPLQLASYIGALNADLKYPFQIKKGIVVVAYTNGDPAKVHEVNENSLKKYWKLWLQRLKDYHVALNPC